MRSAPRPVTIDTYAELCEKIRDLLGKHKTLVFRGQTAFHSAKLVPTGFREDPELRSFSEYEARQFQARWLHPIAATMVDLPRDSPLGVVALGRSNRSGSSKLDLRSYGLTEETLQAILQHYGARSQYIDVTKSIDVALWFSHNRYCSAQIRTRTPSARSKAPLRSLEPAIYDAAWYEPAWTKRQMEFGFLFVIAPRKRADSTVHPKLAHGDLVDLSEMQLSGRMRRQQAGLVYVKGKSGGCSNDIAALVKAIYRFRLPLPGTPALNWHTTDLFPPPSMDEFWATLLADLPFRKISPQATSSARLLRIPEYYNSGRCQESREWRDYRRCDVSITPSFLFHSLRTAKNVDGSRLGVIEDFACTFGSHRFELRKALGLLTLESSHALFAERPPAGFLAPVDRLSVFFEFDAMQAKLGNQLLSLPFIEQRATYKQPAKIGIYTLAIPFIRAIWIIQNNGTFWCRLFGFDGQQYSLHVSQGHFFRWRGRALVPVDMRPQEKDDTIEDERIALIYVLGLLAGIDRGTTVLGGPRKGWPYIFLATGPYAQGKG